MSGRTRDATIIVSREYRADPNSCERALMLLLKTPASKKAAGPAPDGRKDGTKAKGDSACAPILPETP